MTMAIIVALPSLAVPIGAGAQSPAPSIAVVTPAPIPGTPPVGSLPDVQPSIRTWSWCAYHRFYQTQPLPPDVVCDAVTIEQSRKPVAPVASPVPVASPAASPVVLPSPSVAAVEPTDLPPVLPDHYTWAWCTYQRYNGFPIVPSDVDCTSLVLDEGPAMDYYRFGVGKPNAIVERLICLSAGATWERQRRLFSVLAAADRTWAQSMLHVKWPDIAQPSATRLANRLLDEATWLTQIARSGSNAAASMNGYWGRFNDASDRASEAAFALRAALGLKPPPKFTQADCKGR